jgi:hypothetical protein
MQANTVASNSLLHAEVGLRPGSIALLTTELMMYSLSVRQASVPSHRMQRTTYSAQLTFRMELHTRRRLWLPTMTCR